MVKIKYANKTPSNIINHWHECLTRNLDRKFASSTSNSCLRASSFRASDRALRCTSKIKTAPPTWHHKWICLNLQILQHTEWDGANPLYKLMNTSKALPIYNKPAGINSSPPLWLMRLLMRIYSNMSMNLCMLCNVGSGNYSKNERLAKKIWSCLYSLLLVKWSNFNISCVAVDSPLQIHLKPVVCLQPLTNTSWISSASIYKFSCNKQTNKQTNHLIVTGRSSSYKVHAALQ